MNSMADTATKLKQIRESLGVSQDTVARRTRSINLRTYVRAENAETSVRHDTAQQILEAINGLLREAHRPEVILDDLGLKLY
jgi:transcriptional regulator with XRE-family HTH domain